MAGIRFVRKDGQSVDMAIIRKRFFESALDSGSSPERARPGSGITRCSETRTLDRL
jgi:hypothetical protein